MSKPKIAAPNTLKLNNFRGEVTNSIHTQPGINSTDAAWWLMLKPAMMPIVSILIGTGFSCQRNNAKIKPAISAVWSV